MPQQPYLEYLHCLECGYVLATVTEHDGRTSIALTGTDVTEVIVFRALVICPHCEAKREFYSAPTRERKIRFPTTQELLDDDVTSEARIWQIGREIIEKDGG